MNKLQFPQHFKGIIRKGGLIFCGLILLTTGLARNASTVPIGDEDFELELTDVPHICTERGPTSFSAAAITNLSWKGKNELRVRFLGGSEFLKQQVRYHASFWGNYANIRFKFVES